MELEGTYKLSGGKLIAAIYNEICNEICADAPKEYGECCECSNPMGGDTEKFEEACRDFANVNLIQKINTLCEQAIETKDAKAKALLINGIVDLAKLFL